MFDLGLVLSDGIKPKESAAIVTMTGGGGILTADRCEEVGLDGRRQRTQPNWQKYSFGAVNPVDVMAGWLPGLMKETLNILTESPDVGFSHCVYRNTKAHRCPFIEDIAEMEMARPLVNRFGSLDTAGRGR